MTLAGRSLRELSINENRGIWRAEVETRDTRGTRSADEQIEKCLVKAIKLKTCLLIEPPGDWWVGKSEI